MEKGLQIQNSYGISGTRLEGFPVMISTKGRYGLRVMIDLAQNRDGEFISLKSISQRQEISMKYLEMIVATLHKAGLVRSQRGKEGGYKLTKEPDDYSIGEIVRVAEGGLSTVSCAACAEDKTCHRAEACLSYPLWQRLDDYVNSYLDGITLEDILNQN
jgi:Rrf2 family protein